MCRGNMQNSCLSYTCSFVCCTGFSYFACGLLTALTHVTGTWFLPPPTLRLSIVCSHCRHCICHQSLVYSAGRRYIKSVLKPYEVDQWSDLMCLCQYAKTNTALQIFTYAQSMLCMFSDSAYCGYTSRVSFKKISKGEPY